MSAGYDVVLEDLRSMAATFHQEAQAYVKLKTDVAPPIAASGDSGLDSSITSMMEAIAGLHAKLAGRIEGHGDKLQYAHDSYQRHDVDEHGVYEDLMN
ncbi:DUF6317 family protein [Kitasatospora viridis]|uniref:Excreted virulence factor EspC (Type VII ESX diderm) n=1 Tax=Kitasatospora viridis TaxID=281105 RepID=A0A561UMN0_9ACTN|nr:DUF6317 family protein [Kitasatospora viridis]TWG00584.1 hypothetical protein FHX73_114464 [Kitasatospora viridis]